MDVILDLKNSGIETTIKESKSRQNHNVIGKNTIIPVNKWYHVESKFNDKNELKLIQNKRRELKKQGIRFDIGVTKNCVDWEIDWSVNYDPNDTGEETVSDSVLTSFTNLLFSENNTFTFGDDIQGKDKNAK